MMPVFLPEEGSEVKRRTDGSRGWIRRIYRGGSLLVVRRRKGLWFEDRFLTLDQFTVDWDMTGERTSSLRESLRSLAVLCLLTALSSFTLIKACSPSPASPDHPSSAASSLDKVVYGTVLKIDSVQGLTPLGFKQELAEITLLEDCQVVGPFDAPPDCPKSSDSSQVVTLSIPKDKMYGPEIRAGDYIATRWTCKKSDPNSCVFFKYADAMSGSREEGIHK